MTTRNKYREYTGIIPVDRLINAVKGPLKGLVIAALSGFA